jgi:hypothetical protein
MIIHNAFESDLVVGETYYLSRTEHYSRSFDVIRRRASPLPCRSVMSHALVLYGRCGSFNNIATFALGCGIVVKIFGNGTALVRRFSRKHSEEILNVDKG